MQIVGVNAGPDATGGATGQHICGEAMNTRTFAYAIRPEFSAPVQRGVVKAKDEKDARRVLRRTFGLARLPRGTQISDRAGNTSKKGANTRTFVYAVYLEPDGPVEQGVVEAADETDARRVLRGVFGCASLPRGTLIFDQAEIESEEDRALLLETFARATSGAARHSAKKTETEESEGQVKSAKLRHLLKVLASHHEWLKGSGVGQRADLTGLNLSNVSLRQMNLSHADMTETDLSGADLRNVRLAGANLVRTVLRNANLRGADLRDADLSDADLRDAVLLDANLRGADLWRANLDGCVITPTALHVAFNCKTR